MIKYLLEWNTQWKWIWTFPIHNSWFFFSKRVWASRKSVHLPKRINCLLGKWSLLDYKQQRRMFSHLTLLPHPVSHTELTVVMKENLRLWSPVLVDSMSQILPHPYSIFSSCSSGVELDCITLKGVYNILSLSWIYCKSQEMKQKLKIVHLRLITGLF